MKVALALEGLKTRNPAWNHNRVVDVILISFQILGNTVYHVNIAAV